MARTKKAAAKGSAQTAEDQKPKADQASEPHISTAERLASEVPVGGEPASRPKSGETLPGEPTPAEVIGAALNEPSEELVFTFDGRQYGVVDLTFTNWLRWAKIFQGEIEGAFRSLSPLVMLAFRAYPLVNRFRGSVKLPLAEGETEARTITILQNLREIAEHDSPTDLASALYQLGAEDSSDNMNEVNAIQAAAKEGRGFEFLWSLGQLVLKPLAEPTKEVFGGLSFADQIYKAEEKFPDLALLSITSAMQRLRESYDEDVLREKIELMDGFDLFEIVCKQYEHYRSREDKIGRFFGRMLGGVTKSISTATPLG